MTGLNRVLGIPLLTFYGTGMILGAGIYTIVGKAAGTAGESIWISLLIAAFAATLTAFSYAELSSMFPNVGGEYLYLRKAFPEQRWIGTTSGLMMSLAGVSTTATVAVAFSGYLKQIIEVPQTFVAFGLIALFTAISIRGIRESSWMNVVFTLIEISGLFLCIYFGVQAENFGGALAAAPSGSTLSAAALVIFAFFGFENIVNFAEESKEPERQLPIAILLSIAISTALYLLVALSALALLPVQELAGSEAPLAQAVGVKSKTAAGVLSGIALFATANTVLISLVTTSRILLGMSRDGALPKLFSRVSRQRKTPWFSTLFCFAGAVLLLPLGGVEVLAGISSFATLTAFFLVNVALIALRFRAPTLKRPFKVPIALGKVPIFPLMGAFFAMVLLIQFRPF